MDLLAGLANAHPINFLTSDKEKYTAAFFSFSVGSIWNCANNV